MGAGGQESVKEMTGGVKRERERAWSVCLRVCERESRNGEELTLAKIHLLFPERRQGEKKEKKYELCNYNSKRGKTCFFFLMSGKQL